MSSAKHGPGTVPGNRVTGAGAHTASCKAKEEEKFTALFHHVSIDHLAEAFSELKENAAAGVDGLTCRDYEQHLVVRQIASLDCGIVAVTKRDYDVRAQPGMIVGDRIPEVGMGVHDWACPGVLVAHQRAPLLGKWRRFGAHDLPNEHSHHCRSFRANRLIEHGPWDGSGTFRTCRDCRVESGFGDKAEVGFRARQGSFWR